MGKNQISMEQLMELLKAKNVPNDKAIVFGGIARAESQLHTDAVGDCNLATRPGYRSFGLFQVLTPPANLDSEGPKLLRADYNVEVAIQIQKTQGWGAWSTYKSGTWRANQSESQRAMLKVYAATGNSKWWEGIPGVVPVEDAVTGGKAVVGATLGVGEFLGQIIGYITSAAAWVADRNNWIRIIEVIAGIVAIAIGLVVLFRGSITKGVVGAVI